MANSISKTIQNTTKKIRPPRLNSFIGVFNSKNRSVNKGLAPGSLVFIGNRKMNKPKVRIIDYTNEHFDEKELTLDEIDKLDDYKNSNTVSWINVDGLHETELIGKIGEMFDIHPLLQEDILNTDQRAKFEDFENYLFVTLKMLSINRDNNHLSNEQISIVIHKNFVLTFQEKEGDVFDAVRERIRLKRGKLRNVGNDYLAYALLDTIVDNYIYLLDHLGEHIEDLEIQLLKKQTQLLLNKINTYKQELHFISKAVRPVRELIKEIIRSESPIFHKKTYPYLKDLLDIATQATETIETFREVLSDYLNIYHTGLSTHLNEIMKVLTIFSAIFIPLTFIAGVYGMNFEHMPELHYKWGYPGVLTLMGIVGFAMFCFLKWRKWF
ncbi:magnesium/cobalt transporter CorA [Chondrinema litorale]|uniref:magnesium/cobalt transporter CorA n=1 Tax=Chondrinema litorale TaxID=2994555 RepID=UPI002542904C|nr:magnesium/cobalt transporter CorA [Chondrinema litorale]UZR98659.1 magnesium/cobalt transporter CorA [Chondrinema litorale]